MAPILHGLQPHSEKPLCVSRNHYDVTGETRGYRIFLLRMRKWDSSGVSNLAPGYLCAPIFLQITTQ